MGVIYKITSPTGRFYIGKTKRLKIRIWEYRWRSRKQKTIVHASIKKYGWAAHKFEIIEEIDDSLLNGREIYWIKELNSMYTSNPLGMNMTRGGDGNGSSWMHDIERRKKQSERFSGAGGTFYGKHHTEENKKAQSERAKKYNLEHGRRVPKWGAEKGRLKVIRSVLCYDKYGHYLKTYDSIVNAANILKINRSSIIESCNNIITGVVGKYVFRYFTPNFPESIEVGKIRKKTVKRSVLYVSNSGGIIKEYDCALSASIDLGVPKTTINRAAQYNNGRAIRTGHIFIYKDSYKKILKKIS